MQIQLANVPAVKKNMFSFKSEGADRIGVVMCRFRKKDSKVYEEGRLGYKKSKLAYCISITP